MGLFANLSARIGCVRRSRESDASGSDALEMPADLAAAFAAHHRMLAAGETRNQGYLQG